ncbi:MAG TPA: DNA-3-methyladenine glycosylase 2 family protein [Streptosporangiaceae bacterium]|nr:DNA-3-methyladenine glycosylase 2 family protein [Streptosporangiaceae bacterium]
MDASPAGRGVLDCATPALDSADVHGELTCQWQLGFTVDVAATLGVHRRGRGDPAYRTDASGAVWRTSLTPEGPATLRVCASPGTGGTEVRAAAWGPGGGWLLATVPALLGAEDDIAGFEPVHPILRRAFRRFHAVRVGRSGQVFEALVPAVLEQKVVGLEATRAWRLLMLKYGDPAPGPAPPGMRVFPPPRTWARIPSWEWHRAGVEGVRARTVVGAARVAGRLEEVAGMAPEEADRRLQTLPGVGPWTSAEVRQRACGDPDAVSVGDYHLPSLVGWALAGRKVDDAGMLELLAPYAGHRHRAARLAAMSGAAPPRRGPRMAPRDFRTF